MSDVLLDFASSPGGEPGHVSGNHAEHADRLFMTGLPYPLIGSDLPASDRQSGYHNQIGVSAKSEEVGVWACHAFRDFPHEVHRRKGHKRFEGETSFGCFILKPEWPHELRMTIYPADGSRRRSVTVRADYFPQGSPYASIDSVVKRLNEASGEKVYLGDFAADLRLLGTIRLTSKRFNSLTDRECAAIGRIGELTQQAELNCGLWLSNPFDVWVHHRGGQGHWIGETLPLPLKNLRPTTHVAEYQGSLRFCPIEIDLGSPEIDPAFAARDAAALAEFSAADHESVEKFADELCRAARRRAGSDGDADLTVGVG